MPNKWHDLMASSASILLPCLFRSILEARVPANVVNSLVGFSIHPLEGPLDYHGVYLAEYRTAELQTCRPAETVDCHTARTLS